jgi:hypothetical protein
MSGSTIMYDLREIKQLIDVVEPVFNNPEKIKSTAFGNVKIDCFHMEKDKYSKIKSSEELANLDKSLIHDKKQFLDREFCSTSQFWRGCIRIIRN